MAFPGGPLGALSFAVMFAVGSLVLAVDLMGQADRHFARPLTDARPASGLLVQTTRLLAVVPAMTVVALLVCFYPFAFRHETSLLALPTLLFLGCVLLPLIVAAAACGLAGRAVGRSDGAGIVLGGLLLAPLGWHRLVVSQPLEIFQSASRHLGVLVPTSMLIQDALLTLGVSVSVLGIAALFMRRHRPRSPLRSMQPPALSRVPLFHSAFLNALTLVRDIGVSTAIALILVVVGVPAWAHIVSERRLPTLEPDWTLMTEPPGTVRGNLLPPRIAERRFSFTEGIGATFTGELDLLSFQESEAQQVAALTFGPAVDVVGVERIGGGTASVAETAGSPGLFATVLQFNPPLDSATTSTIKLQLKPRPGTERYWALVSQPSYSTFEPIPMWYGEGLVIRYPFADWSIVSQSAPFELKLPDPAPQRWLCGAATSRTSGGVTTLLQTRPSLPAGLFASHLEILESEETRSDVRFAVFPEHKRVAGAMMVAYARRLDRLQRAFDLEERPLVFYETPHQSSFDWMAMSSASLDELDSLVDKYGDFEAPTAGDFDIAFARLHRGAVKELFEGTFAGFENSALLRDSWIDYLDRIAFASGQTRELIRERRDFVFVPWEMLRTMSPPMRMRMGPFGPVPVEVPRKSGDEMPWDWVKSRNGYPFDLLPRDEAAFRGTVDPVRRPALLPPVSELRFLGFHHMLRGTLGDENYRQLISRIVTRYRGRVLTISAVRQEAESISGKDLGWFFTQWLEEGVVPRYKFLSGQVILAENPETRNLEYTSQIRLANLGDGTMPVEVVMETDGDKVTQTVDIGANEEKLLTFVTKERPISAAMDPLGWIVQMPEFDTRAKRPLHPILYLKTVKEL